MCVAALVYYNDFLKENLHHNGMERTSIILTETIPLDNFVTTNYPSYKTSATPEITGIPADVLLVANMEDMIVIISDLKSSL